MKELKMKLKLSIGLVLSLVIGLSYIGTAYTDREAEIVLPPPSFSDSEFCPIHGSELMDGLCPVDGEYPEPESSYYRAKFPEWCDPEGCWSGGIYYAFGGGMADTTWKESEWD